MLLGQLTNLSEKLIFSTVCQRIRVSSLPYGDPCLTLVDVGGTTVSRFLLDTNLAETNPSAGVLGDPSARHRLSSEASESYVQTALREVTSVFTSNQNTQSEVSHYGAGFLKTAALFMPGRIGLAGSIILGGLDQASPNSSGGAQLADFALGGLKGAGMRGIMHAMGSEKLPEFVAQSPAVKGVAFGISNRVLDTVLTRQNYLDANGNLDGATFGANMMRTVANPTALISDAATFVVAQGLVSGVTKFKPQFFESSPLAQTVATSASFGLSNGAAGEIIRQQDAHEKFDLSKIVGRSLLQGGIDAVAGAPGGMRANLWVRPTTSGEHQTGVQLSQANPQRTFEPDPSKRPLNFYPEAPKRQLTFDRQPAAAQLAEPNAEAPGVPGDLHSSFARTQDSSHINLHGDHDSVTRFVQVDTATEPAQLKVTPPEQRAGFIGPLEPREAAIKALTIPERSLEKQPERVKGFKSQIVDIAERSDVQGPFKSFDDFYYRGLVKVPTDTRIYSVSGHDQVEVLVREKYAARLDDIAAGKPTPDGAEDYSNRLSPADLPPLLDAMPNSGYFSKIFMSDMRNPEDAWVSQGGYNSDFVSAMSMVDGELNMYKTERSDYLRRDVLHEWSHELRYQFWDDNLTYRFKNAIDLESKEWNPSAYAGRNNGEQWAVLGERMIGNDAKVFVDAAERAPIRTVIWMRALKKCLDTVPEANKSVDHDLYVARQKYVDANVLPLAVDKLNNFVKTGTQEQAGWASDVLKYLHSEGLIEAPHN